MDPIKTQDELRFEELVDSQMRELKLSWPLQTIDDDVPGICEGEIHKAVTALTPLRGLTFEGQEKALARLAAVAFYSVQQLLTQTEAQTERAGSATTPA